MSFHPAQLKSSYALAGSGAVAGATSITLKSFQAIDGTNLAMADFGSIGYLTLEPGNGTQEEQVSFTGISQNANGTATLTGIKTVLFLTPYTESSGLAKTHPGSASVVASNTAGFYNQFPAKDNDETITGQWTFDVTPISPVSVSNASTTVKGVAKISVAPLSATDPISVGDNDTRVVPYAATSTGTDAYAITVSPNLGSYAAGQKFTFKADVANTGAATLNVNSLGAVSIKKYVSSDLATGDIAANQVVLVEYDGTNFQMLSPISTVPTVQVFTASGTYTTPTGVKYIEVEGVGAGANGGSTTNGGTGTFQAGAGGSPGGYFKKRILAASLGATETVTIGTNAGTRTTSFGAHASATGGTDSSAATVSVKPGAPGVGTGGDINTSGTPAGGGIIGSTSVPSFLSSGMGGSTPFGSGGTPVETNGSVTAANGNDGQGYGSGGSGSARNATGGTSTGGTGKDGYLRVTEYY